MSYMLAVLFSVFNALQSFWHCANCLMLGCIQYNSAMFFVFSGPLFANLQSYVYLDLLIWGVAPLIFLFLQPYLKGLFQRTQANKRKRLCILTIWTACIWVSYLFMNYSQSFNWNYFHRVFNLDFGYFLFDISNRIIGYIIALEDSSDAKTGKKCTQKHCGQFCHFRYAANVLSYAVIFWFSISFDLNSNKTGQKVLSICSFFSSIISLIIPISYFFKHKDELQGYKLLIIENQSQSINENNQDYYAQDQISLSPASQIENIQTKHYPNTNPYSISKQEQSQVIKKQLTSKNLGFYLIQGSLFINLNYYSLWIMESLKGQNDQFLQYNLTIVVTSTFFLLSTFCYYFFGHHSLFQQKITNAEGEPEIKFSIYKIALFLYGIYLCFLYFSPKLQYGLYCGIFFIGFQQILSSKKQSEFSQRNIISDRTSLISQIAVFFVVPLIFEIFKIGSTSLLVYALLSGIMSCIGIILL